MFQEKKKKTGMNKWFIKLWFRNQRTLNKHSIDITERTFVYTFERTLPEHVGNINQSYENPENDIPLANIMDWISNTDMSWH